MFKINIEKYKLESYFLGILYLGIICGNLVIVIALFNSKIQDHKREDDDYTTGNRV